jgi:hypothetical protein
MHLVHCLCCFWYIMARFLQGHFWYCEFFEVSESFSDWPGLHIQVQDPCDFSTYTNVVLILLTLTFFKYIWNVTVSLTLHNLPLHRYYFCLTLLNIPRMCTLTMLLDVKLHILEVQFQSRSILCGICCGQSGIRVGFSLSTLNFACHS